MKLVSVTAIYDNKETRVFLVKSIKSFEKILPLFFNYSGSIELKKIEVTKASFEVPKGFYYCQPSQWHNLFKLPFPAFKEAPKRTIEGYRKCLSTWQKVAGLG